MRMIAARALPAAAIGWLMPTFAFVLAPTAMRSGSGLIDVSSGAFSRGIPAREKIARSSSAQSPAEQLDRSPMLRGSHIMSDVPPGGKFVKLGGTEDSQVFGPRCILASGVPLEERRVIRSILEEDGHEQERTPLVVVTPEIADKRVEDVLKDAPMIGLLQEKQEKFKSSSSADPLSMVILISGFTTQELRNFASRFRTETGVRAAFAKAVPNAMTKSVARLCGEVAQDHADALAGKLHGGEQ